jgi:group II intron reverse transcriptase/maturase
VGITESQITTATKLERIAWLSQQDSTKEFGSLMHLINKESLEGCFNELKGNKAPGIDGVTKTEYGHNLSANLDNLVERMKRMAYHPQAVRQVLIPKEGKPGATRPLGVGNIEDKLVQKMMQKILESIYEPLFLDCSYGFRPGRGCHDAIRAMHQYLYAQGGQTVIDLDITNFFGSIDHQELEKLLRKKIKDDRFMRYIIRMFKAGVLAKGEFLVSDEGVAQGSPCSPILANLFAHQVIDDWFENVVKKHCKGQVKLYRYCDDACIFCEYESDAIRIKAALTKRISKYHLSMNEEKTKLVNFARNAKTSFSFLGFSFYWGLSRKGIKIPKVKTDGKRMKTKLKRVNEWAREMKDKVKLNEFWKILCLKLAGHIRYYGVSSNFRRISIFRWRVTELAFKWLNRRSQRKSFTWEQFCRFMKANPAPSAKIHHSLFASVTK